MARSRWKLTVRHGSEVTHAGFDDLTEAVAAMRARAMEIRSEGPARPVRSLRDFGPQQQVRARLQLTGRGLLRKPVAGIDVRGDGTFVAYRGGVGREELDPTRHETPFDLVRETLEEETDE
ncbi:MAG: hypothetical protein U0R26_10310 [Solirubrobacterales bacterium]